MLKNLKNKKKKRGFTLIELIIVIAIIAVLAVLALPKLGDIRNQANINSDKADAKTIANAAATLLLDGDLTTDTSGKVVRKPTDPTKPADNGDKVGNELQNIPKSKAKYDDIAKGQSFTITLDASNNIEVYVGTVADGIKVFPE